MYRRLAALSAASALLLAACGGAAPAASPTASPTVASSPTPTAPPASSAPPAASDTPQPSGPATVTGPSQVAAGAQFEVGWTGPNARGDYVTIVAAGATKWTDEPYFYTNTGTPGKLTAPITAGAYELWYVYGPDDSISARQPITVGEFAASVSGPASVGANTRFDASWTGPDGPRDYVTIVAAGATTWTNEPYFYTNTGATGQLLAPIAPGNYELWYVSGQDPKPMARAPITVTPMTITLDAPASVKAGGTFEVSWTGPDGPGDYVTIVAVGATRWTNEPYFYTANTPTGELTAPDQKGAYEIWYVPGQDTAPGARRAIVVD